MAHSLLGSFYTNFLNDLILISKYSSFNTFDWFLSVCLNELYLSGMLQSENTEIDAEKLSARLEVLVMLRKIDIPFFCFRI